MALVFVISVTYMIDLQFHFNDFFLHYVCERLH